MNLLRIALLVFISFTLHSNYAAQPPVLEPINVENAAQLTLLDSVEEGRFVAFDGQSRLVTTSPDEISVWNVSPFGQITLESSVRPDLTEYEVIQTTALSPDGRLVAFASVDGVTFDGRIRLLDLRTRNFTTLVEENWQMTVGMYEGVFDLEFSPDGHILARTVPFSIELWNVETRELLGYSGNQEQENTLHTGDVYGIAFSPDGHVIASAGGDFSFFERHDSTIRLWDTENYQPIAILEGHTDSVQRVVFSPDGSLLASSSVDGTIRLWNTETLETAHLIDTSYSQNLPSLLFSPDGSLLAASGRRGTIALWDVETGNQVSILQDEENQESIVSLGFNSNGTLLASTRISNLIQLWGIPPESES